MTEQSQSQEIPLSAETRSRLRVDIEIAFTSTETALDAKAKTSQEIARMFVAKELANTFLLAYDLTETTNPRTTLNNVTVSLGELRHERLPEEPRATTSQYAEERQFIQNYWDTAWQNIIGAAEIYHTPQEIVSAANVCDRVLEVMKMLPHQDPQTFLSRVNDHLRSAGDSQTPSTT